VVIFFFLRLPGKKVYQTIMCPLDERKFGFKQWRRIMVAGEGHGPPNLEFFFVIGILIFL